MQTFSYIILDFLIFAFGGGASPRLVCGVWVLVTSCLCTGGMSGSKKKHNSLKDVNTLRPKDLVLPGIGNSTVHRANSMLFILLFFAE